MNALDHIEVCIDGKFLGSVLMLDSGGVCGMLPCLRIRLRS